MSDTDPKDESSSAETHDTSSTSTSSQADTPSHTESEPSQESQTEAQPETQPQDTEPTADSPSIPSTSPTTPDLEKARAFLRDPEVRKQTAARKATYLSQKGYSQEDIDVLLHSDEAEAEKDNEQKQKEHKPAATLPPIVTYPEFVANSSPQPPPPLVTPQVLAAALYGTAATSSLLYAAARLVLAPMVDALNDARSELHETAGAKLTALTEKLEGVVSVVPQTSKPEIAKVEEPEEVDDDSSYDDPAEVFHRDIGVQTSLPPSPALPTVTMDSTVPNFATGLSPLDTKTPTPSQVQADRVAALASSVRALSQGWVGSADVHADIKATVDVFRDDVDKLSRPPAFTYGGGMYNYGGAASTSGSKHPGYVTTTRNEPDDEIRKAKENIRRVKGALLSTRTFPTAR